MPIGLALPASLSSRVGSSITLAFETLFAEPSEVSYSANGFGSGLQTIAGLRDWTIIDPSVAHNLSAYTRDCFFPDVNAGLTSLSALLQSTDLTAVLGSVNSPALFTRVESVGGAVDVRSCQDAWTTIEGSLGGAVSNTIDRQAKLVNPQLTTAEARAVLIQQLPILQQEFLNISGTAE